MAGYRAEVCEPAREWEEALTLSAERRSMRLLVLENEPSHGRGGQEMSLFDICRGMAERGHQVHLLYNREGNLLPLYRGFCCSVTRAGEYSIDRKALPRSLLQWARSLSAVSRTGVDVVYCNQYLDALFAGMAARKLRVPLVCHLRLPPPDRFCGQWQFGLGAATRFIAVSHATSEQYIRAGFRKDTITVVYNGIDPSQFAPADDREATRQTLGIPGNAFTVIYTGRIDPVKNPEMLIEAFARISPEMLSPPHEFGAWPLENPTNRIPLPRPTRTPGERPHLLMVGSTVEQTTAGPGPAYAETLYALCRRLKVEERVHWLGRRADVPALFRAADLLALPSRFQEPFGRVLIEAMACGIPAVATAVGGIPEILSGPFNRFLVPSGDVDQLAAVVGSLSRWRETDPDLGQRCRDHVIRNFPLTSTLDGAERCLLEAVQIGPARLGPSLRTLRAWRAGESEG